MSVKDDPFGLRNTVAVVTGATRGVGKAIAVRLASAGASVAVVSRKPKEAKEIAKEIAQKSGSDLLGIGADVSKRADAKRMFEAIDDWTDLPLSALVNNAGHPIVEEWWTNPLHKFEESELERAIREVAAVDLQGSRWCAYYALPRMLKQDNGSLVFTSSTPALVGYQGIPYTEAKAALLGLMRDLARAYGPKGIRANAVAPGNIRTDWLKKLDAKERKRLEKENPLQRFGDPDEVAKVVLFLASDLSSFVTGETIIVDGGTVMR